MQLNMCVTVNETVMNRSIFDITYSLYTPSLT